MYQQLDNRQQKLIKQHLELIQEANKQTNLTRIDTFEQGMLLHVEDSLAALPELEDAPKGLYGDLGSGGGFPGIPLAIATGRKTVLIDARQKKMEAVARVIEELGLQDQISTYAGRAELLARKQPKSFTVLTARALAQLSVLEELASPLLKQDGRLICYKANVTEEELNHAKEVEKQTGMSLINDRQFTLGEDITRRILVFEKTSKPQTKLPRQEGAAQKNPL